MKPVVDLNPEELRQAAFDAILRELGPVGLARFVRENGLGYGDYTRDRKSWLGEDQEIDNIVAERASKPATD